MNTQSSLSATIICLTKNIMNIPSHFCFCYTKACVCYHDGAWMPCIGPHVLVANILMHGSSSLRIYGLSLYKLSLSYISDSQPPLRDLIVNTL